MLESVWNSSMGEVWLVWY